MLYAGLVALMLANTNLRALVGNRIYPTLVPKTTTPTYPLIVYNDVSSTTDVMIDLTAITSKRIQFDCRSTSYVDAKNCQAALHNLFDGLTTTLSDGTVLQFTEASNDIDLFDDHDLVYRAVSDWIFQF